MKFYKRLCERFFATHWKFRNG